MKTPVYESLHAINQASQQMVDHLERLKTDGLLTPEIAEIHKLGAEQIRAEACHTAILNLAGQEHDTASEVEQQRLERTERLKNPE